MSYSVTVKVTSPTFSNKRLNTSVRVGGTPGPAGPSFDQDFDAGTIPLDGITVIDYTLLTAVPSNALKASAALTSIYTTESIENITNMPANIPIRFFPASGVTITFVHGTGTNNPRCSTGINVEVNGTKKEWIEFTKINGVVCQTNSGIYSA